MGKAELRLVLKKFECLRDSWLEENKGEGESCRKG